MKLSEIKKSSAEQNADRLKLSAKLAKGKADLAKAQAQMQSARRSTHKPQVDSIKV